MSVLFALDLELDGCAEEEDRNVDNGKDEEGDLDVLLRVVRPAPHVGGDALLLSRRCLILAIG